MPRSNFTALTMMFPGGMSVVSRWYILASSYDPGMVYPPVAQVWTRLANSSAQAAYSAELVSPRAVTARAAVVSGNWTVTLACIAFRKMSDCSGS